MRHAHGNVACVTDVKREGERRGGRRGEERGGEGEGEGEGERFRQLGPNEIELASTLMKSLSTIEVDENSRESIKVDKTHVSVRE